MPRAGWAFRSPPVGTSCSAHRLAEDSRRTRRSPPTCAFRPSPNPSIPHPASSATLTTPHSSPPLFTLRPVPSPRTPLLPIAAASPSPSFHSSPTSPNPSPPGVTSPFADPNSVVGMLMAYAVQLQQQQQAASAASWGAEIHIEGLTFHPPGCEDPLLRDINLTLPANSLGLVIGRSGSGKTTLLQVLAGLSEQTEGQVRIVQRGPGGRGSDGGSGSGGGVYGGNGAVSAGVRGDGSGGGVESSGLTVEERMQQVGLVFQFPERHFLGEDLAQELTFAWPRLVQYWGERQLLSTRMQQVLEAVGLQDIPLHLAPWELSGGQQRRLALATQLVRQPALLLLDEPLAGLDWVARQEVVTLLKKIKTQCTLLVVSHDLAEIAPLVDCAWRMRVGGGCEKVDWPPPDLAGLEQ